MRCAVGILATLLSSLAVSGCGGNERVDNAVEAREGNQVELAGVRYRVVVFRELNPFVTPGDALWRGDPPRAGVGLYLVSLSACGVDDEPARATDEVHLEDAFGQRFKPRVAGTVDAYQYGPRMLEPGECLPHEDSAADETFGGAALVFALPFEAIEERPIVLELGHPAGEDEVRIQLDV